MAMLAEPRRKVRYTVNPSGHDWRDKGDSSQFGQRLMHSMGWREGRGLGKDGQGAVEPIKVRQKNDQRGIGCSGAYAAESMPQSDDFASLLSQLNQEHGSGTGNGCHDNNSSATATSSLPAVSLEAKSKASRARLHYHRFTRGKDVSVYGSKALACIFGTRAGSKANNDSDIEDSAEPANNNSKGEDSVDEEEDAPSTFGFGFQPSNKPLAHSNSEACLTATNPLSNGLHLVQSQTSLQDYFRTKMLERKIKLEQQQQQQQEQDLSPVAIKPEPEALEESQSSWTSESSCSAASTLSGNNEETLTETVTDDLSIKPSKRVCFSLSPQADVLSDVKSVNADGSNSDSNENDMLVIDFSKYPGSQMQRVLGYLYY
ncbi:hypothetical protein BOX15_Mlig009133g1 [Macrostomum lignano]|uniref:G-patch domain-containing protein n=1 Tax=Macrostomum lignano TaxID=282301 RepID=A0A267EZC5_9PLAT|nr:hypothetical protein BOX15_Mlig009133g1 [Macrostomum lignano]